MNFDISIPILRFFDEAKAKAFYIDYLGFKIDWEHRFGENSPLYFQISKGNCVIQLSEHHGDGTPGTKIKIACDDIHAYHEYLLSKQYRYLNPGILEQSWGELEMSLTDPFGNAVIIFCELNS